MSSVERKINIQALPPQIDVRQLTAKVNKG